MPFKIGIDFDNTLIDYRKSLWELATQDGEVPKTLPRNKEAIKNYFLTRDGNISQWRALQAKAYGNKIFRASAFRGALEFVNEAVSAGHEVWIVSHKTTFSESKPRVNMREAALRWLRRHKFPEHRIRFAETGNEKIEIIRELNLNIFVDDLLEVLNEEHFPSDILRVWFTQGQDVQHPTIVSIRTWDTLSSLLGCTSEVGCAAYDAAYRLLKKAPTRCKLLSETGNNRIFSLSAADESVVIKRSYTNESAVVHKSFTEFTAISRLNEMGIKEIPKPLFHNSPEGFAIYSFISGHVPKDSEIRESHLCEASDFLLKLYRLGRSGRLTNIGPATNSRFCLRDYPTRIEDRIEKIMGNLSRCPLGIEADYLLSTQLLPLWKEAKALFHRKVKHLGLELDAKFDSEELIPSPSDFGFHNALLGKDGRLTFVDFEYFGWDDMVKLMADFFHSAAQNIPYEKKWFVFERFVSGLDRRQAFLQRWDLVSNLIGIEWILIVLNVFVPEILERRLFAVPSLAPAMIIGPRLQRASRMLSRLQKRRVFGKIPNQVRKAVFLDAH